MKLSKPQTAVLENVLNGADANGENRIVVRTLIRKGMIDRLDTDGSVMTTGHSWASLRISEAGRNAVSLISQSIF